MKHIKKTFILALLLIASLLLINPRTYAASDAVEPQESTYTYERLENGNYKVRFDFYINNDDPDNVSEIDLSHYKNHILLLREYLLSFGTVRFQDYYKTHISEIPSYYLNDINIDYLSYPEDLINNRNVSLYFNYSDDKIDVIYFSYYFYNTDYPSGSDIYMFDFYIDLNTFIFVSEGFSHYGYKFGVEIEVPQLLHKRTIEFETFNNGELTSLAASDYYDLKYNYRLIYDENNNQINYYSWAEFENDKHNDNQISRGYYFYGEPELYLELNDYKDNLLLNSQLLSDNGTDWSNTKIKMTYYTTRPVPKYTITNDYHVFEFYVNPDETIYKRTYSQDYFYSLRFLLGLLPKQQTNKNIKLFINNEEIDLLNDAYLAVTKNYEITLQTPGQYDFFIDDTFTDFRADGSLIPENNILVRLEFDMKETTTHTLIFETNGGTSIDPITTTDEHGVSILGPIPTTTRDGYTFVDWYEDEALTIIWDDWFDITGIRTIYAKWQANNTPVDPGNPTNPTTPDEPSNNSDIIFIGIGIFILFVWALNRRKRR